MPSEQLWPVKTWTGDLWKRPGVLCTGGTLVLMVFCRLNGLLAVAMLLTLCVSLIAVLKIYFDMFNSVTLDLNHDPDHLWGALTKPCVHFFKVKGALKVQLPNNSGAPAKINMFANAPVPGYVMAAVVADWETVALEKVTAMTCGRAGPCDGLVEEVGGAGPRSGTLAWAGWYARTGRAVVCAGCESGSCVEGEEALRLGEMAERRNWGSFFQ